MEYTEQEITSWWFHKPPLEKQMLFTDILESCGESSQGFIESLLAQLNSGHPLTFKQIKAVRKFYDNL